MQEWGPESRVSPQGAHGGVAGQLGVGLTEPSMAPMSPAPMAGTPLSGHVHFMGTPLGPPLNQPTDPPRDTGGSCDKGGSPAHGGVPGLEVVDSPEREGVAGPPTDSLRVKRGSRETGVTLSEGLIEAGYFLLLPSFTSSSSFPPLLLLLHALSHLQCTVTSWDDGR